MQQKIDIKEVKAAASQTDFTQTEEYKKIKAIYE